MKRYYDFDEAAKELGLSHMYLTINIHRLKLKCKTGKYGKKLLNQNQLNRLRPGFLIEDTEPTGNIIEVIKVTETYYIYESKLNSL